MSFQPRYNHRIITRLDLDKKVRNTSILGPIPIPRYKYPGTQDEKKKQKLRVSHTIMMKAGLLSSPFFLIIPNILVDQEHCQKSDMPFSWGS